MSLRPIVRALVVPVLGLRVEPKEEKVKLEDVIPVTISTDPPCKGCENGFDCEEDGGRFWHVWEGRAYPCTAHAAIAKAEGR